MKSISKISNSKNETNSDTSKEVDTKIKNSEHKILQLDIKHNQAVLTETVAFIEMGGEFHKLKKLLKAKGRKFEKHCEKKFPHIRERKRQRCMKLSRSVDLKEHSDLKYIPITTLETLDGYRKGSSNIGEMLIDRAGFTNLKTLSDEPTAKQISDFKR